MKMKYVSIIALGFLIIIGCGGTEIPATETAVSEIADSTASDTLRIVNEELDYEITIIEPGFYAWLATQPPRGFYGQEYLEIRNRILVTNYNNRVLEPQRFDPNIYLLRINYNPNVDYGYEVNYLLWNWFQFFQKRYNQKLR